MELYKIIRKEPFQNCVFINHEDNGIFCATVAQRTLVKAQYRNLTKREIKMINDNKHYVSVEQIGTNDFITERNKLFNLATIYYREIDGAKVIFDIHYHKNRHLNGYRSEEQVITDTNDILNKCNFTQKLTIGGFMCYKKKKECKTNKIIVKKYKKL